MRHVLVAKVEGRIAKVECHQCGGRHRYRPVGSASTAKAARRSPSSGTRRKSAKSAAPLVEADASRPPRPFDTTATYQAGDRVVHSSFGEGVVQEVIGASKIRVHFEAGEKKLVHRREAG